MANKEQYAQWIINNSDRKGTPEFDTVVKAYQAANSANSADMGSSEIDSTPGGRDESWLIEKRNALATAPINAYLGVKQFFGGLSETDQKILAQNKQAESKNKGTALLSNVLTTIPAAFIPGANTVAGAGVVGGITGLAQPVAGNQDGTNIVSGKLMNTGVGMLAGMGGQTLGNALAKFLSNRLSVKQAQALASKSKNAVRDATLAEARAAGYVIPNSEISSSAMADTLESFAGKAALKQEMTHQNQQTTNALARKAVGLAEDSPISQASLKPLIEDAWKPYQEIASLPIKESKPAIIGSIVDESGNPFIKKAAVEGFNPKQALQDLKQLRYDAKTQFNYYNRSLNPEALTKGKELRAAADALESKFANYASSLGRPDLVESLNLSRVALAKIGTVERALNESTGDISSSVLKRMLEKGTPLTGELKQIASASQAFPKFMGNGPSTPAPGVSYTNLGLAGVLGLLGSGAAGPAGALAGLAPFARGGVRSLLTTQMMQRSPSYGVPLLTKVGAKVTPEIMSAANRAAIPYLLPAK